jgi:tetratricopeptide (TPR) repeat protein
MRRRLTAALAAAVLAAPLAFAADTGFVSPQRREQALKRFREGELLLRTERFADAEPEFKAAIGLDPLLVNAHYSLGQTYMALKQYAAAQGAFRGAIEAHNTIAALRIKDSATADLRAREEIQELRESIRAVRTGMTKTPTPERENQVLRLESRLQELENSMGRGSAEASAVPAEFRLALGSAYFRGGQLAEAVTEYEAAAKARRNFGEAHNNLAVVHMLLGHIDEAEAQVKLAKKAHFPVHPQFEKDLAARKKGAKS